MPGSSTLQGTLSAAGQSDEVHFSRKRYNMSVWGTFVGTIQLERSFDSGTTWLVVKRVTEPYEGVGVEVESNVLYRFNCIMWTSGMFNYRLGLTKF